MKNTDNVKLVVFVPLSHSDVVRQALGEAGAGKIGNYDFCAFSSLGTGRFKGNDKSNPTIGEVGKYESVQEERIEVVVSRKILKEVIEKIKQVHPYEEVAFDIYFYKLHTTNYKLFIFKLACFCLSIFGSLMMRSPCFSIASALSISTSSGSKIVRENEPQ